MYYAHALLQKNIAILLFIVMTALLEYLTVTLTIGENRDNVNITI